MVIKKESCIAYKSIIMRCDELQKSAFRELSSEVEIEFYKSGMEDVWVQVQKCAGEFKKESDEQVKAYFMERYGCQPEELKKRCIFLKDIHKGEYIGTCMAWFEAKGDKVVPVLHWLAVADDYSGRGYARMLITQVMELFEKYAAGQSIYLHTQPCSYRAIKLYNDFGFCMSRNDVYGTAVNEYEEAMEILEKCMSEEAYKRVVLTSVE